MLLPVLLSGILFVSLAVCWIAEHPETGRAVPHSAAFNRGNPTRNCGAASLYLICRRAQRPQSLDNLLTITHTGVLGTSMLNLRRAAEELGWRVEAYQDTFRTLRSHVKKHAYAILHVNGNHFVAVLGAAGADDLYIADPALGVQCLDQERFEEAYDWDGVMLLLRGAKK